MAKINTLKSSNLMTVLNATLAGYWEIEPKLRHGGGLRAAVLGSIHGLFRAQNRLYRLEMLYKSQLNASKTARASKESGGCCQLSSSAKHLES